MRLFGGRSVTCRGSEEEPCSSSMSDTEMLSGFIRSGRSSSIESRPPESSVSSSPGSSVSGILGSSVSSGPGSNDSRGPGSGISKSSMVSGNGGGGGGGGGCVAVAVVAEDGWGGQILMFVAVRQTDRDATRLRGSETGV